MLACPSRLCRNPFQNNENCESSITIIYQSEISKIYIRWYLPQYPLVLSRRLLRDLSLLRLKTMNGVISWYVLALQLKLLSGVSRDGLIQPLV